MTEARIRDAQRTRQLLLDAAERLFAERGVDGTSTDEIARASGVNKAMINYHFGGKDGLYTAIVSDLLETALGELEALPAAPLSGEAKLREFVRVFARAHGARTSVSSMILREVMAGGRRMEEPFRLRFLRVFRVLSEILAQGNREGSFRPVATIEAHLAMMGALTFFFATRQFRERMLTEGKLPFSPISAEEYVAFLEELVTRGLAPSPSISPTPKRKPAARAKSVARSSKPTRTQTKSSPRRTPR
ncbi:MAG: TetR family transcriptional regulator [Candidatus Eisenbacteria bacterium]